MQQFYYKFFKAFLVFSCSVAILMVGAEAFALVQITNFTNMTFGTWGGTGDMVATNDLCVHNTVDANYRVTATGSGGSFNIISGANNIPYQVRFKKNGGAYNILTHNSQSAVFNNADIISATCGGTPNSTLEVTVTEAALSAAESGNYSGTLTLLLEPG